MTFQDVLYLRLIDLEVKVTFKNYFSVFLLFHSLFYSHFEAQNIFMCAMIKSMEGISEIKSRFLPLKNM